MAGVSQPSPLTPALDRARSLIAAGALDAAQVLLERAVEIGREKLGEDEPDVLTAQRELAGVLLRSDDPMAARRVLEDAYAAGQWRLGDADPLMLHISHDLGVVAEELGNKHEARKAFGRVVTQGPQVLGDGHPFIARARGYLGEDPSTAAVRPEPPDARSPMTPRIPVARTGAAFPPVTEPSPPVADQRTPTVPPAAPAVPPVAPVVSPAPMARQMGPVTPPAPVTHQFAPPAPEQVTVVPPAPERETVVPPALEQVTVVPPAPEQGTVVRPAPGVEPVTPVPPAPVSRPVADQGGGPAGIGAGAFAEQQHHAVPRQRDPMAPDARAAMERSTEMLPVTRPVPQESGDDRPHRQKPGPPGPWDGSPVTGKTHDPPVSDTMRPAPEHRPHGYPERQVPPPPGYPDARTGLDPHHQTGHQAARTGHPQVRSGGQEATPPGLGRSADPPVDQGIYQSGPEGAPAPTAHQGHTGQYGPPSPTRQQGHAGQHGTPPPHWQQGQHGTPPPPWQQGQVGQYDAPSPPWEQGQAGQYDASPPPWQQGPPVTERQPEQAGYPGWQTPPQAVAGAPHPYPERKSRGRTAAIALTAVATLVSAVAVGALVVVLADRSQQTAVDPVVSPAPTGPVLKGDPPTAVDLDDKGTSVRVKWADPTAGKFGFIVTMAREGQQLRAVSQVGPGKTTTFVAGLNPDLEYCFAVVVVYATDQYASSPQVCTQRN